MPSATLKALAKKSGKTLARAEYLWDKAKEIVDKEYPNKGEKNPRHWALVVGIVKKMMGMKEDVTFKEMLGCEIEVEVLPGELNEVDDEDFDDEALEEAKKKAAIGTKPNQGLVHVSPELMKKLKSIPSAYNLAKSATVGKKVK